MNQEEIIRFFGLGKVKGCVQLDLNKMNNEGVYP